MPVLLTRVSTSKKQWSTISRTTKCRQEPQLIVAGGGRSILLILKTAPGDKCSARLAEGTTSANGSFALIVERIWKLSLKCCRERLLTFSPDSILALNSS